MNTTILIFIFISIFLVIVGILSIYSKQRILKNIFPIKIIKKVIIMRFNLKKNDETLKISPGITLITLGILINFIAFILYLNNKNLINKYFTIIIPIFLLIIIIMVPLIINRIKKL